MGEHGCANAGDAIPAGGSTLPTMDLLPNLNQPTPFQRFCGGFSGGAFLFVISFLLYGSSLGYPLLFLDDAIYFVGNPLIDNGRLNGSLTVWTGRHYGYTPLTHLSIWFDIWMKAEWGVHGWWLARLQQLAWVSIGALGVRALMTRITGSPTLGWWIALIYAVHPVCATTALWLAMRRQALCLAFIWWGAVCFLKTMDAPTRRAALFPGLLTVGLVFAACLSRFNAVSVIALYPLLGYMVNGSTRRSRSITLTLVTMIPIAAMISLIYIWPDASALQSHRLGDTMLGTLLLDGQIIARYLLMTVWPLNLGGYYSVNEHVTSIWIALGWWVLVLSAFLALILLAHNRSQQMFLLGAVIAVVGPTLNGINQVMAMADHYLQPGLPFLVLMAFRALQPSLERLPRFEIHKSKLILAGSATLFFIAIAFPRNFSYSSSKAFIIQALQASPGSGFMLGHQVSYFSALQTPQDTEIAHAAATKAIAAPDFFRAPHAAKLQSLYYECGRLVQIGKSEEAHRLLTRQSIYIAPLAQVYLRAFILADSGERSAALGLFMRISPVDKHFVDQLWMNWKEAELMPSVTTSDPQQRPRGIIDVANPLDEDQKSELYYQQILYAIARLHLEGKDYDKAARYALTLAAINPRMIYAWEVLAEALENLKRPDRAAAAKRRFEILKADITTTSVIDD